MELNKKLVMTFKTTDDKKVSISVDNPREDLSEEEKRAFYAAMLVRLLALYREKQEGVK